MVFEGARAIVRARCNLWVYLGTLPVIIATIKRPAGKNKSYPEAFRISWQPSMASLGVVLDGVSLGLSFRGFRAVS